MFTELEVLSEVERFALKFDLLYGWFRLRIYAA